VERIRPQRHAGYAPLRDYAVIGNKRTAALVALDGAIDWLALPAFDGPSVFGAMLDPREGGRFTLAPTQPFGVERSYRPGSAVLETTFTTSTGSVRVTDAMSRPIAHDVRYDEIVRRVDGLAGEVPMRWSVEPRFEYGAYAVPPARRGGLPVFVNGEQVLAVQAHHVGDPQRNDGAVAGEFTARDGEAGALAVSAFHGEPLAGTSCDQLLERLDATDERWRRWAEDFAYSGPWRDAVLRSALTLELLVDGRTGGMVAAPTMALPEAIGGERNFDYRYGWLRDANLALEAMLSMGFRDQVHASLAWTLAATATTSPWLRPMYRLDGGARLPDRELPLAGYRDSRPVVLGNSATSQLQLGNYGDVFDLTWNYVRDGNGLAPRQSEQLADCADYVTRVWDHDDASIWELGDRRPYTQSKLACWLALQRAVQLADIGQLPRSGVDRWRGTAEDIRVYVDERCWSDRQRAYARSAGSDELDAAVLLAARGSFLEQQPERFSATIDAVHRELGAGNGLVYRYSGMADREGAFVACSFWAAEALARVGRADEGAAVMDALVGLGNDVGLFSEEIHPGTGEFLGNLPQALSHLALITAAAALATDGTATPDA
jgi:GH15 family glucan-1,4-alpha-glucosidase